MNIYNENGNIFIRIKIFYLSHNYTFINIFKPLTNYDKGTVDYKHTLAVLNTVKNFILL